jgi:hypothetical protein
MVLIRTDVSEELIAKKYCLVFLCRVLLLLVTVNVVPRSLILFTLMMEATSSS